MKNQHMKKKNNNHKPSNIFIIYLNFYLVNNAIELKTEKYSTQKLSNDCKWTKSKLKKPKWHSLLSNILFVFFFNFFTYVPTLIWIDEFMNWQTINKFTNKPLLRTPSNLFMYIATQSTELTSSKLSSQNFDDYECEWIKNKYKKKLYV